MYLDFILVYNIVYNFLKTFSHLFRVGLRSVPAHKGLEGAGCLVTHHVGAPQILGFVPQYLQDGATVRTFRARVLDCAKC